MNPPPAEGLASRLFLGPALRTQPDRRLVTLVRDGYETAFEEIVRRYGKAAGPLCGGDRRRPLRGCHPGRLLEGAAGAARLEGDPRSSCGRGSTGSSATRPSTTSATGRPSRPSWPRRSRAGSRSAAEEAERREELVRAARAPARAAGAAAGGDRHARAGRARPRGDRGGPGLSGGAARQAIYRARQALRDGVGMLIPLPLLRALIDHGAEAGAAAGAGGAVAAGGAIGGAGRPALKVGAITAAVLAGGLGTGLALKDALPSAARNRGRGGAHRRGDELPLRLVLLVRPELCGDGAERRGKRVAAAGPATEAGRAAPTASSRGVTTSAAVAPARAPRAPPRRAGEADGMATMDTARLTVITRDRVREVASAPARAKARWCRAEAAALGRAAAADRPAATTAMAGRAMAMAALMVS